MYDFYSEFTNKQKKKVNFGQLTKILLNKNFNP